MRTYLNIGFYVLLFWSTIRIEANTEELSQRKLINQFMNFTKTELQSTNFISEINRHRVNLKSIAEILERKARETLISYRGEITIRKMYEQAVEQCPCGTMPEIDVIMQYYYSIKDISIGGMCICYGHSSKCPADPTSGKFTCQCEHNTAGLNCEKCAPGFNQYKWMPGTDDFQCQACNCHGHANECYYDPLVEERKESLNIDGDFQGGGVCVGCKHNTAGVNCETCIDGYYRRLSVGANATNPCTPCICNPYGAIRVPGNARLVSCVKDITFVGVENNKLPGHCLCRKGYTGTKCDRCAYGYRRFPFCEPCRCNVSGSLNTNVCEGKCSCKRNVQGESCDECKAGYYNLQTSNQNGCEQCFCFGVTSSCQPSALRWSSIHTNAGWEVREKSGRRKSLALIDPYLGEPFVHHDQVVRDLGTTMYYWSCPRQYLGDRLSSYGGYLRYVMSYDIRQGEEPFPIQYSDVIMEGNTKTLLYNPRGVFLKPQVEKEVQIKLSAFQNGVGWVDANSWSPVNKADMMSVLRDVKKILIRAVYSRNHGAVYRIRDVKLDVASRSGKGSLANSVEKCHCPPGYLGFSCEKCEQGYWRNNNKCLPCQCYGHSTTCNQLNGACENCAHSTMGMQCERCKPGYYGKATDGTPNDCQSCSCPLPIASNNFSPTCRLDRNNGDMICLQCPVGYKGKRCEMCTQGYFGEPTTPGGRCQLCQCNGNSQQCNRETGRCEMCQGHSAGEHCQRCKAAYYGDAVAEKNCQACNCHPIGSLSRQCNVVTGQCPCIRGVHGRRCDACMGNRYLSSISKTCVSCDCSTIGSKVAQCRFDGTCVCKNGVTGQFCDSCARGFFGFSQNGCTECDCEDTNGNCDPYTGECVCPPHTFGYKCTRCSPGTYDWKKNAGCKNCKCSYVGSIELSHCDNQTGRCQCKSEYGGMRCDQCRQGYYDFPSCKPCRCNAQGTVTSSCSEFNPSMCNCTNSGQCFCKENVIGKRCDRCAPKSFGMSSESPLGCTACFCSGVTDDCSQAQYIWGSPLSLSLASTTALNENYTNNLFTQHLNTFQNDIFRLSLRTEPYYWKLPKKFNGNLTRSYGGKLRYTIDYHAEIPTSADAVPDAIVVLRGGEGTQTTIQYKNKDPTSGTTTTYVIQMMEFGWTNLDTGNAVSRREFGNVLKDVQFFLIKASYGYLMNQSRLSNVFLDVAVPGIPGRGDSIADSPLAVGVEQCNCPPGYEGLSCQKCSPGYMRVQQGRFKTICRPCSCNNRSNTCLMETGQCLNCAGEFTGLHCEKCKAGYYLAGNKCRKCQCPGLGLGINFSLTCHADSTDQSTDFTCDSCRPGYEGKHCERCADGYYGNPFVPGGSCSKCGCNMAGSLDRVCNKVTGQCYCDVGIQGRICDQCQLRHVITPKGCVDCNDGCVGKLLDEVEFLQNQTVGVDINSEFSPPWNRLLSSKNAADQLQNKLTNISQQIRNGFRYVRQLKTHQIVEIEARLLPLANKSKECFASEEKISDVAINTNKKTKKSKKEAKALLTKVESSKDRIHWLVDQLRISSNRDANSMSADISSWFNEINSRNLSRYLQLALNDIRSTENLANVLIQNFTKKAKKTEKRFNKKKKILVKELKEKLRKFKDIEEKFVGTNKELKTTRKRNDMNRQLINQNAKEIIKVKNEAIITNILIRESRKLLKEAMTLYENGSSYMHDNEELVKSNLNNVSKQLSHLLDTTLNPVPRELMLTVKTRVKDYKLDLEAKAEYIEKVHREISQFSFNQTEAASRWTNIANAFNAAEKAALMAHDESNQALNTARNNLGQKAKNARHRNIQVHRSVMARKLAVISDSEQLHHLNDGLRSANQSARELRRKHDLLLDGIQSANSGFLMDKSSISPEVVYLALSKSTPVLKEVNEKLSALQKSYQNLDIIHRGVERHPKLKKESVSKMRAVSAMLDGLRSKSEVGLESSRRVKMLSDSVQRNITNVRKLIEKARRKAADIRQVSVNSDGGCAMMYKPEVTPAQTTEIILNIQTDKPNNLLFYLARKGRDFFAIETGNFLVTATWNLGGEIGVVRNPVPVRSRNKPDWYRIEVVRRNQNVNLTVYQVANKTNSLRTARGTSRGKYSALDVNEEDQLFVGGVFNTTPEFPSSLIYRTFTGCMGEAFLQGKSIGLWNFRKISDVKACGGCVASERLEEETRPNVYSYSGHSYSILKLPLNYDRDKTRISFKFQTFSSEGLLVYMGSKTLAEFLSLELRDGRLVLKLDLGNGVNVFSSEQQYNTGKWMRVVVSRDLNIISMKVESLKVGGKQRETIAGTIKGPVDTQLDLNSDDILFVGGFPSERFLKQNVTRTSFIGCLREFAFMRRMQGLKSKGMGMVIQDAGVSRSCPSKINHDIGISANGYVELPPVNLPSTSYISLTFNTQEPDAILLLATNEDLTEIRKKRENNMEYLSLYLSGGHLHATLHMSASNVFTISSKRKHYSDGRAHLVTLTRRKAKIILKVNEDKGSEKVVRSLSADGRRPIRVRRLFVGGLPHGYDIQRVSGVQTSLNGCLREAVVNSLINFRDAIKAKNSYFGTCQYVSFKSAFGLSSDSSQTSDSDSDKPTTEIPKEPTDSHPRDDQIFVPNPAREANDTHCREPGKFEVRDNSVNFGSSPHSHLTFSLKKKISKSFSFEMKLRTRSNSSGLLLYAGHPTLPDFFALKLKDGKPVFQFNNGKETADAVGIRSVNDGRWHKVRIRRRKRRGWLLVDRQKKVTATAKKGDKRLEVSKVLYVGGLPRDNGIRNVGQISNSMDVCIRELTLNRKISLNPLHAHSSYEVQSCFKKVSAGAYFNGLGFAKQRSQFRVGQFMLIEMDFRTWRSNGILLSVNTRDEDGLILEMVNGSIALRVDDGSGPYESIWKNSRSNTGVTERNIKYQLCNGKWHHIRAEKYKKTLRLSVDGIAVPNVTSSADAQIADTDDFPLFIGGLPDFTEAKPKPKLLQTSEKFEGCMRNLRIKERDYSFDESVTRLGVFPNSCPSPKRKNQGKKSQVT